MTLSLVIYDQKICSKILDQSFDHVYQLAADMGGAGYIFTGDNDADVNTQFSYNKLKHS